jgi:hypothetical protein
MGNKYFAICKECGSIEWLELHEGLMDSEEKTKANYLKRDGSIAYKNRYVRLRNKDYLDIVCSICESPVVLIPFDVCNEEERQKVFNMEPEERVKFAERFELLDNLD